MTVLISTCCIKKKMLNQICNLYKKNNIFDIELSAGKYFKNLNSFLNKKKKIFNFQVHNYFPVPEKPFVFNLASENKIIINKSLKHAKRAIKIASNLERKIYSFHAGYLVDPSTNELGKDMKKRQVYSKDKSMKRFISNVKKLAKFAKKYNVKLLIENNVITKKEFDNFQKNIVLMADPNEINYIFSKMPNNVRMLLDVAHFKVSSKGLKFNLVKSLKKINKWIEGYHFSDNNGNADNNRPFNNKSWFWKYLKKDLNYYSIEVYNQNIEQIKNQKKLLEKKLNLL